MQSSQREKSMNRLGRGSGGGGGVGCSCWQQMFNSTCCSGGGGVGEVASFPTARVVRERGRQRGATVCKSRQSRLGAVITSDSPSPSSIALFQLVNV